MRLPITLFAHRG